MPSQRRHSRRQFLKRAAAGAAAAALGAGCARRNRTGGPITLDFYCYSTREFRYHYAEKLIPAFEKSHPGIKIRFNEAFGEMYDGKLLTLIAGGAAPDVYHVVQSNFPMHAAKGVALPLDELLAGEPRGGFDLAHLYPQMADSMRGQDGRVGHGPLLGLPSDFSTIILVYNKDHFDRHNLPYPSADWTWDDFLAASRKLTLDTDGDGRTDIWGCANQPAYNRWPAWIWMAGGDIFNPDVTRCVMDSPEAILGFKFYTGLSLTEKVAPRPNLLEQEQYHQLFAAGRMAMIAESRYIYKRFLNVRRLDFNWDVAPMPRGPAARATTFIWGGNCIYKGTRYPRECWEFLKFISGEAGAAVTIEAGNALPPVKSVAEAEVANPRDPAIPKNDRAFLDAIEYGRVAPCPKQFAEYTSAMVPLHESFIGLGDPEEVCRSFTRKVNDILSGGVF